MAALKKLAGQTIIYGISSILGRLINYLLTPLYTRVFPTDEYGEISILYALIAFLMVILTYGMETTFFRFSSGDISEKEKNNVFATAFYTVFLSTAAFALLAGFFSEEIASAFDLGQHPEYVLYAVIIVALDVIAAIPLAKLRFINRPFHFVLANLGSILLTVGLNLFFLVYLKNAYEAGAETWLVRHLYNPDIGIGYVFISNMAGSLFRFLLVSPLIFRLKIRIDPQLRRKMIRYTMPLLILGFAGIINETFDRLFFVNLSGFEEEYAKSQLGIYNACYKVAMILSIGVQAFRYAAEPYIFSLAGSKDAGKTHAAIMKFYFIAAIFIALAVLCFEDVALLLIDEEYRSGAFIIPVLLLAYIIYGAVFNLSFWYKLSDRTRYGAFIAIAGAVVTLALNILLVPLISYAGAAWATLAAYIVMLILSYALGQKIHPVPYPVMTILVYFVFGMVLVLIRKEVFFSNSIVDYSFSALLLLIFAGATVLRESKAPLAS